MINKTTILKSNICSIADNEIDEYIQSLPGFFWSEIKRFRFSSDQKSRLLGRLMLKKCLADTEDVELLNTWRLDANKKPYIEGWHPFNIAHSGEVVLFCFSSNIVGIDIEINQDLQCYDVIASLHPEEQKYILNTSCDVSERFYEIWVKKEAFLKAIGIGITSGLKEFNCLNNSIVHQGDRWFFHMVNTESGFTSCLCSLQEHNNILIKDFCPERITHSTLTQ